jgi:ComF family protein
MTKVAEVFSDLAIDYLERTKPFGHIDYVISVPLHTVRKRTRGYNQSEIIAKKIASHFNWNYVPSIVKKHKATLSQANLSAESRFTNVEDAFSVDSKNRIEESNLLIVDDVFTTGSTVNEISRTLQRHQVNKVYVLTMTRA